MTDDLSEYDEPTDVGPAAGGDRTATDADRRQVVDLLNAAHAEGYLTVDERDTRVAAVGQATTFDDLVPLTRDLVTAPRPVWPGVAPTVMVDPGPVSSPPSGSTDAADQIVAFFSGSTRSGHWRVRRNTSILAIFGGADLDLSEAVFEAREVQITVFCLFGGVELTVPEGVEIVNSVGAIFGGSDVKKLVPPDPSMPVITVRGFVAFGGVNIHHPKR